MNYSCFLATYFIAALTVVSACSPLRAAVVLSNMGQLSSGFGFGVGTNNPTSLPNLMRAVTFRTGLNPNGYWLNSVDLGMGGSTGSGLGSFQLQLFATAPFLPTTSVGDFSLIAATSDPIDDHPYTFAFTNQSLILTPQTYYAIVARSPSSTGPSVSQYGWRNTSGIDATSDPNWLIFDQLVNTEGSSAWSSIRSGPYQFAIDATAVPEPTQLCLFGCAMAAAVLFSRRRSRGALQ